MRGKVKGSFQQSPGERDMGTLPLQPKTGIEILACVLMNGACKEP